jgi:hypothetical protein
VGILGVLRDTPDYKRFSRSGRLVEGVKYTGDSGIFSRELSYVPLIDPGELFERHRKVVETLNGPDAYFDRCMTLFDHLGRRPFGASSIGMAEIAALVRSFLRQGIFGGYRRRYWSFLLHTLRHHPGHFQDAMRLAVQGHHLILATQQALHVDDMKTFFSEAVEHLEGYCQGYREAFQRNVGAYASRLMQTIHHRFAHFQDEQRTLQHNAEVLLKAAQEYYDGLRKEFRHQVREPLEKFQQEIERILATYAGGATLQPQGA